jgi:hypothetical protein
MRTLLATCSALLLLCVASASAQSWTEYRPPGAPFRVEMPGRPMAKTEPVEMGKGSVDMVMAIVDLGERSFLAIYADYPDSAVKGVSPEQGLINARDGMVKYGKLVSDRPLSVSGFPAREYVVQQPDGYVIVSRSVQAGNRLYQMLVIAKGGSADDPLTRRFLDSFSIPAS